MKRQRCVCCYPRAKGVTLRLSSAENHFLSELHPGNSAQVSLEQNIFSWKPKKCFLILNTSMHSLKSDTLFWILILSSSSSFYYYY